MILGRVGNSSLIIKVELLSPHLIEYGDDMTGFEFYCESRYGEEV